VPQAKVHLPSGLVCTRDFKVLTDRHLEDRMHSFAPYGGRRPRKVARLFGTCTTLNYCYAGNLWHWLVDCLPKIHTLEKAGVGELTVLMSTTARAFQRETLERILPASMRPRYEHGTEWIEVENFLWVSLVSHRCMGFLPGDYYEAMRGPIFRSLGLDRPHEKRERIYISRAKAAHRRVKNDDEVAGFLAGYGFRRVHLEAVSFREEVELFHGAEAVVGPHGAGLGDIIYSGDISVGVLYPTRVPPNYFHSLACGLGQRHHFLCHDEAGEDDDFEVDLGRLKQLIEHGMRLQ
jgi:capsular polysaccharide biosynthesis protein